MNAIVYFFLFCHLTSFFYISITGCPLCVGKLDREQDTPPFFSEQYDQYWHLNQQENATLVTEINTESEEEENS